MPLILGLGNPGPRFEGTRHNVGFDVVRRVSQLLHLTLKKRFLRPYEWTGRGAFVLALPLTYMNRSGDVVGDLLRASRMDPDELIVVCDNMDLEPGSVRVKRRGSQSSHNGVASVMRALGNGEFARIYVGIGRPAVRDEVIDHVLDAPPRDEADSYHAAIDTAAEAIVSLQQEPIEAVMNRVNRRQ